MPGYSFADVLKHTEATESQLKRWTDVGVIEAASGKGLGTGHHRRFSLINLVEVAVAEILAGFRIATPKIGELIAVVPVAVKYRFARLWVDRDGNLNSISGVGVDPFVKKKRGLVGVQLDEILLDIEQKTGETFPKAKTKITDDDDESVMLQFARDFAGARRKRLRR